MEVKAIVVFLLILSVLGLVGYFPKATDLKSPKLIFWISMISFLLLFIYGLYLNEYPRYI